MEAARGCCAGNRLVTTPGVSWSEDQVLWKLPGVVVLVKWLVTTPGGRWDCDQILYKLPGIIVQVTVLGTPP